MPDATLGQTVSAILALQRQNNRWPVKRDVVAKLALQQLSLDTDMSKPAVYGQALTDAKKALAEASAAAVVKTLDSPLLDLFVQGSLKKTMYRYDPNLMNLIRQVPGHRPPVERNIQKVVTALSQCEHQHVLATSHTRGVSVRQFLTSGPIGQMQTIDAIWNECTVPGVYNRATEAMYEPDNDFQVGGTSQLPSSVHPDGAGDVRRFKRGQGGRPFLQHLVGFRVEGSYDSTIGQTAGKLDKDINRIKGTGMVPQVTLDWLMLDNGKDVAGTVIATGAVTPRLNIEQRDLWNESGVCVARSLFGATAFPLRDHEGGAILWAVDVSGLVGYDTEQWQLNNVTAGSGPWRSGEKCYGRVPAEKILGYVVIDKLGAGGSGWKFRVPPGATWQMAHFPSPSKLRYMQAELAAWAGVTATVDTDLDFQQTRVPTAV